MNVPKLTFSIFMFLFFIVAGVLAEEIFVPSGGNIQDAVDNAEAGDMVVLASGGEYLIPEYIVDSQSHGHPLNLIDKNITIKAEDGASEKPEVSWTQLNIEGSNNALELRGLKVISTSVPIGNYFLNFTESFNYAEYVRVIDCEVSGFPRCALRANRAENTCDEFVFDNCTFYGFDDSYRFFHFETHCNFSKFIFTNCTVSGFTEAFLWSSSTSSKRVIIDNCTFNDYTVLKPSFIEIDGDSPSSITITDCIFTNFVSGKMFETWFFADTLRNCRFYNVGDTSNTWDLMENFIQEDPQYADAANFNFTLPEESPLRTAGTDGGPIGDPRWAGGATDLNENDRISPFHFELGQNYPNPFNNSTTILYTIPERSYVKLNVYDVAGQKVDELISEYRNAGTHSIQYNADRLSSGIYIYKLVTGNQIMSKKLILIK